MPSTITAYTTFVAGNLIKSSEVNANLSNHRGSLVPITEATATATDNTYDLGTDEYQWRDLFLGNKAHFQGLATTPSLNPTTGSYNLYSKTDGLFYALNSSGTETKVSAVDRTPVTFTPAWSGVTVGNAIQSGSYYREGREMVGVVQFVLGSTSGITGDVLLTIPGAEVIDGTYEAIGLAGTVGTLGMGDAGTNSYTGKVYAANSTHLRLADTRSADALLSSTVPFTWTTNDIIFVKFRVAIVGWS